MCFEFLSNFCLKHFVFFTRIKRDIINVYAGLHVKYPLFLKDVNKIWIFSIDFWKIFKYQIWWKSFSWDRSCSMRTVGRTDGRTDRRKYYSLICNSTSVSKSHIVWILTEMYTTTKCVCTKFWDMLFHYRRALFTSVENDINFLYPFLYFPAGDVISPELPPKSTVKSCE